MSQILPLPVIILYPIIIVPFLQNTTQAPEFSDSFAETLANRMSASGISLEMSGSQMNFSHVPLPLTMYPS